MPEGKSMKATNDSREENNSYCYHHRDRDYVFLLIFQTTFGIRVDTMRTSENTMYSSTLYILHHLRMLFNFLTSPGSARDSLAVSGCDVVIVKPKGHRLPRQSIC